MKSGISLAESFMFLLVVLKHAFEISYTLVLPLPVRPLRGSVLRSPSLRNVRIWRPNQWPDKRILAYRQY